MCSGVVFCTARGRVVAALFRFWCNTLREDLIRCPRILNPRHTPFNTKYLNLCCCETEPQTISTDRRLMLMWLVSSTSVAQASNMWWLSISTKIHRRLLIGSQQRSSSTGDASGRLQQGQFQAGFLCMPVQPQRRVITREYLKQSQGTLVE